VVDRRMNQRLVQEDALFELEIHKARWVVLDIADVYGLRTREGGVIERVLCVWRPFVNPLICEPRVPRDGVRILAPPLICRRLTTEVVVPALQNAAARV
jgi:hypothetical protein